MGEPVEKIARKLGEDVKVISHWTEWKGDMETQEQVSDSSAEHYRVIHVSDLQVTVNAPPVQVTIYNTEWGEDE
jgi:hypothetical protein